MPNEYNTLVVSIAEKVEESTGIPAYPRTVLNVLNAIRFADDIFWISRYSREAFNLVVAIIKELKNRGFVSYDNGRAVLTPKGENLLSSIGYEAKIIHCDKCKGRRVLNDLISSGVIEEFLKIQKERPQPIRKYDQGYVTPETTLARVAYMYYRGDLKGRDIIMLGDDDLVSIAVGLTGYARRVAVVDIDDRLTKFIAKVSRDYGLNIEILTMDLRKPLPDDVAGQYDVFQTDPLETVKGFRAFVGRGIATLKGPRCAGYFYLTLVDSSLDKWREIQNILVHEFRVVITDIIPDFSEYINWGYFEEMHGWQILPQELRIRPKDGWYTSTMFRVETLRGSRGFMDEIPSDEDIYEDEELASA